jgi:transcriptional regulator with XRE-family HTH domain
MVIAFKLLHWYITIEIDLMVDIGLTRKEKEKLVIDLYKRGLTYAQIAKEAHVSLRDIAPILNKTGEYQSLSNSSQAYKMFEEGSSPIQVAIALNLRANQVSEYYREWWNLNGLYQLNQMYEELRNDIWSISELNRRTKAEGLSPQQVSRILKTTTTLENNNRNLEYEQARLEFSNKQAAETFQQFTALKQKDCKTVEENEYTINQQKREIEKLNIRKARLENNLYYIQQNDETCIKVKQAVTQVIESVISNPRRLLRIALASLFESERKNPGKLRALYYNRPSPSLSAEQILLSEATSSSISPHEPYGYADEEDAIAKLLFDEAEQSFNRLVDAVTNRCINWIPNDKSHLRRYYRYLSCKMEEVVIMKSWILETCPSLISCIMILPCKYFLLSKSQMSEVAQQTCYQSKMT